MPTDALRIRTLIAEDEEPARRTLRSLLAQDPDIHLVGEAWGDDALEAVRSLDPDLLLLDVRMPGMDGFELLAALEPEDVPFVVFVTAHDEYAVDAFEVRALDYLLKPFSDDRFRRALVRAKERMRAGERGGSSAGYARTVTRLRETRPAESEGVPDTDVRDVGADRLVLHEGKRLVAIPHAEIAWIEASGPYVEIHAVGRTYLVRYALEKLARRLHPHGFHRIHRSAVVNLDATREIRPLDHGDALVLLADGTRLKVSRSRRAAFEARVLGA